MVNAYRPLLPGEYWNRIREFVTGIVTTVEGVVSYARDALMHAVAYHVYWAHCVAGLELDETILFRRDVIGHAVSVMPTSSPSTMGRNRSLLLRVGEVLGVIDIPAPLPPLRAADASAPYTDPEVEGLRTWAYLQRDSSYRASAQALLALGLGAGVATRDLTRVRALDVDEDIVRVDGGEFPRRVRVSAEWVSDLAETVARSTDSQLALFRPGVAFHKNTVLTFLNRSTGTGPFPSTQRMRVTWLVQKLSDGTPMQDLLYQAGLKSMDALVRYQRFLPPPALAAGPGTATDSSCSPGPPRPG